MSIPWSVEIEWLARTERCPRCCAAPGKPCRHLGRAGRAHTERKECAITSRDLGIVQVATPEAWARTVKCPTCEAGVGKPCRPATGGRAQAAHTARIRLGKGLW